MLKALLTIPNVVALGPAGCRNWEGAGHVEMALPGRSCKQPSPCLLIWCRTIGL